MEDVKQSIVKVGKEIDQTLEKLDKCQSESDKAHFQSEIKLLREEKNHYLREKEQLREQQRLAGIISLKMHVNPHINIAHHPLNPFFLIV